MSARAAEPMSGTLSNACAATSPAQHSRTNASRSITAGRSCIDSSTPCVPRPRARPIRRPSPTSHNCRRTQAAARVACSCRIGGTRIASPRRHTRWAGSGRRGRHGGRRRLSAYGGDGEVRGVAREEPGYQAAPGVHQVGGGVPGVPRQTRWLAGSIAWRENARGRRRISTRGGTKDRKLHQAQHRLGHETVRACDARKPQDQFARSRNHG